MPMIWRVSSMPADDLKNTASAIAAVPIVLAPPVESSDGGGNIAAADVAPVEFILPSTDVPEVVAVKPRSRGTLPMVGMFVLMVITALYFGRAVLMPILFGIIIAVVLTPVVAKLSKFRIAEPIAAAIVILAMLGSLVLVAELLVIPAWDMLAELPVQVQNLLAQLLRWVRSFRFGSLIVPHDTADLTKQAAVQGLNLTGVLLQTAQGFIVSAISAMVLAFFLFAVRFIRIIYYIDKIGVAFFS